MRLTVDRNASSSRYESLMAVWGHVQHELLFVCWALADAALLTPFLLGIMGWARYWSPGIVLLWLLILMLFAFYFTRLMSAVQLPPQHQQTITAITLFLIVVVTLPTFFHEGSAAFRFGWVGEIMAAINKPGNNQWLRDVIIFATIVLVWVRGLQLGQREYSVYRAGLRLRVGGLILAPMVIWLANTRLLWDSTPYILLFFLASLTALAIIRAQEIEQEQQGVILALNPRWLAAVFLASLLVIFTAGTAAVVISGDSASRIIGWLAPIWISIRLTGTVALTTLLFLLVPVLEFIELIINLIGRFLAVVSPWLTEKWAYLGKIVGKFFIDERIPLSLEGDTILSPEPLNFEEIEKVTVEISRSGQMIILLLSVALILLTALLVNRLYQETSIGTRLSGRIQRRPSDQEAEPNFLQRFLGQLGLWRDWQTAVSIRRIYHNMLRAADASGYPRLAAETPYEFLRTLAQAWPDNRVETELITTAYVRVRYGELPETSEELQAIRDAWRRLEETRPIEQVNG